jgi:hypothetical protein
MKNLIIINKHNIIINVNISNILTYITNIKFINFSRLNITRESKEFVIF